MANAPDRRQQLRDLNLRATAGESVFPVLPKTDSSLKKNTGFVKRIRTINSENAANVLSDVRTLSLEKYLSEIAVAYCEALLSVARNDDILPFLEVGLALHQRFGPAFVAPVLSSLVNFLGAKGSAEPLPRHKFVLKFVFSMHLVGLCTTLGDCSVEELSDSAAKLCKNHGQSPIILPLLKSMMAFELRRGHTLSVVASFVRYFKDVLVSPSQALLPENVHAQLLQLLTQYTAEIVKVLVQLRKDTALRKERLRKASIRTGKLLEDLQQDVDDAVELEAVFDSCATVLCEVADVVYPENKETGDLHEDQASASEENVLSVKQEWWDDAADRDFHQVIPSGEEVAAAVDPKSIANLRLNRLTEGECVVKFLTLLENAVSEQDILVCSVLVQKYVPYNKATRNKLLKFFSFESKKMDNVNIYARFLKINETFLAEVIECLTSALDQGFRSQIHHGRINFRTISFFVELVKFKLIPKHVVFHKIRRLTLDLAGTNNATILLIFYQDCGKFLLFEPEYLETTKDMLDLLQLRSKSASLSPDEKHVIRNMFSIVDSYVNPKNKEPVKEIVATPIQDFISQIIKILATPQYYHHAKNLYQQIDFINDVEAQEALFNVFQKPEALNLDNYELLARLLCSSGKKRKFLVARVVSALIEQVYRGLESCDYRNNSARTSQVKLLASFYNEKVIDFRIIVDLLFRIVCFGHPNNLPVPNSTCEVDKSTDYFRISMCCSILKRLNFGFVKNSQHFSGSVKSLEGFLMFLQYYSFCKMQPLPRDVKMLLDDVYTKFEETSFNDLDLANNFLDAATLLQAFTQRCSESTSSRAKASEAESANPQIDQSELASSDLESEISEAESEDSTDEDSDEETVNMDDLVVDSHSESDDGDSEDSESDSDQYESEMDEEDEEQQRMKQRMEALKVAEETKLISAMDKSIQELRQDASGSTKPTRSLRMPAPSSFATRNGNSSPTPLGMKLNFLSKSNKLREVNMPSNKQLEERILKEQQERRANQEKILSLVDQMN
ncbi:hypothetical protein PUMCH_004732 [Australozyma saopauloensis]|uniref:Nonsense-mediated mRNA decay protein 2 n=1 Tax=Australozyma saopauloensis TaxID=291208 RepID=A0AAX4HFI5_9ASCO|nr:hypothetical protein PUMCH_004732 [[Candida] saopauloensis]